MTEARSRTLAAGIVAACRSQQIDIRTISVADHDGGARVLITLADGLMLNADLPVGHFTYDRVADAFSRAMGRATMET